MIMLEWTWRVSIIYRWCARWIGNEVSRKLPPLSNQASSGIMEQVLPREGKKLSLFLSLSLSFWMGSGGLATFTAGWWHSPEWHWLKGKKCASEHRFKNLSPSSLLSALLSFMSSDNDTETAKHQNVQLQHLMCTLVLCLKERERESWRQTHR